MKYDKGCKISYSRLQITVRASRNCRHRDLWFLMMIGGDIVLVRPAVQFVRLGHTSHSRAWDLRAGGRHETHLWWQPAAWQRWWNQAIIVTPYLEMRSFQSQSGTSNLSHLFLFCPRDCLHNPVTMQTRCHCAAAHWPASVSSAAAVVVAAVAGVVAAVRRACGWGQPRPVTELLHRGAEMSGAGQQRSGCWRRVAGHHRTCTIPCTAVSWPGPGDEWCPVSWPGHGPNTGAMVTLHWHLGPVTLYTSSKYYSLHSTWITFITIITTKFWHHCNIETFKIINKKQKKNCKKNPKIIDPMQTKNHHSYNLYNFYTLTL